MSDKQKVFSVTLMTFCGTFLWKPFSAVHSPARASEGQKSRVITLEKRADVNLGTNTHSSCKCQMCIVTLVTYTRMSCVISICKIINWLLKPISLRQIFAAAARFCVLTHQLLSRRTEPFQRFVVTRGKGQLYNALITLKELFMCRMFDGADEWNRQVWPDATDVAVWELLCEFNTKINKSDGCSTTFPTPPNQIHEAWEHRREMFM